MSTLSFFALEGMCQANKNDIQSSSKELMINGIPYSQYKAEQDALKQKQPAENKTTTAPAVNNHATPQL
jgi:hypothetical protein